MEQIGKMNYLLQLLCLVITLVLQVVQKHLSIKHNDAWLLKVDTGQLISHVSTVGNLVIEKISLT